MVTDVIVVEHWFALAFNLSLDPQIYLNAGYITIDHTILQFGQVVNNNRIYQIWIPDIPGRPSPNLWITQANFGALTATNGLKDMFLYRPRVVFDMWGPGGTRIPGEFAVAEEDHYFLLEW